MEIVSYLLSLFAVYVGSTLLFDLIHFGLHQCSRSRFPLLKGVGSLHDAHHLFLGRDLRFRNDLESENLWKHLVPETVTSVVGTLLFSLWFPLSAVLPVCLFHMVLFYFRVISQGRDSHHVSLSRIKAPRTGWWVDLHYHSLHHIFPHQYYSSLFNLVDRILGTACQIDGRIIAVTGSRGSFGSALSKLLQEKGAHILPLQFRKEFDYKDYSKAEEILKKADILVLAHGSKEKDAFEANARSFAILIEKFLSLHARSFIPGEVWAVGSEIESHPAFGAKAYYQSKRRYARVARGLFGNREFIYRHIVPSAFTSPMGKGLISGMTAAKIALFFIQRGFCYIPVTYSGIAFLNYFKFLFRWNRLEAKKLISSAGDFSVQKPNATSGS